MTYKNDKEAADAFAEIYTRLKKEIAKVIIGQEQTIDLLLSAIFCNGHVLLVGVPGLAKTLLVQTLSDALQLSFHRIQFTPDLMPSDILGSEILDKEKRLSFALGPIFAQIVLADEINRTPPKTQAALLEAMQERAVTIGGKTYDLKSPFFVFATQNPIEQEGTYPLPEAQLDRFMFHVQLDYPTRAQEIDVVRNTTIDQKIEVQKIMTGEDILYFQHLIRRVPATDHLIEYAVDLVRKTRPRPSLETEDVSTRFLQWGAGPRASQHLVIGAKCHALLQGKYAPDTEDVQAMAVPVLRHRIVRNFQASADNMKEEDIIHQLL